MSVQVVGTGVTRFGLFEASSLSALAEEAVAIALDDAALDPKDIGLVVFGNAAAGLLTGQEMIRAQVALGSSRLAGVPAVSVENACASGSSAFHLGWLATLTRSHEFVVVVAAEKMSHSDRGRAARALKTAAEIHEMPDADEFIPGPSFMDMYAAEAVDYMERTGASSKDLAGVVVKNTANGSLNPIAQVRQGLGLSDVLSARMIADPLTRPMCSSIGDGAAAVVLTNAEVASRRGVGGPTVLASKMASGSRSGGGDLIARTAADAYAEAGFGPRDLDVAEVHDAAAPAELMITEDLGLARPGDGARFLRDGDSRIGGLCAVNPSGGLLARGHAIGATGLAQIVEIVEQLRGRSGSRQQPRARIGLAQNSGGVIGEGPAACCVTLLGA